MTTFLWAEYKATPNSNPVAFIPSWMEKYRSNFKKSVIWPCSFIYSVPYLVIITVLGYHSAPRKKFSHLFRQVKPLIFLKTLNDEII